MSQDFSVNDDAQEIKEVYEEKGTITYATEVISTIVGVATTEVEGIACMVGAASISELFSGKPKGLSRGVRVEVGAEEVAVDVSVAVDYGMPIQTVGRNVQENIRKSIETMTGLHVLKVDVHVLGVSFEKENKELEQGQEVARLQSGTGEQVLDEPVQEAVQVKGINAHRVKKADGHRYGRATKNKRDNAEKEQPDIAEDTQDDGGARDADDQSELGEQPENPEQSAETTIEDAAAPDVSLAEGEDASAEDAGDVQEAYAPEAGIGGDTFASDYAEETETVTPDPEEVQTDGE